MGNILQQLKADTSRKDPKVCSVLDPERFIPDLALKKLGQIKKGINYFLQMYIQTVVQKSSRSTTVEARDSVTQPNPPFHRYGIALET